MDFVTTQSLLCHLGRNMNKNTNVLTDLLLNLILFITLHVRTRTSLTVLAQGSKTRRRATMCPVTSGPKRTSLGKPAPTRGICPRAHRGINYKCDYFVFVTMDTVSHHILNVFKLQMYLTAGTTYHII